MSGKFFENAQRLVFFQAKITVPSREIRFLSSFTNHIKTHKFLQKSSSIFAHYIQNMKYTLFFLLVFSTLTFTAQINCVELPKAAVVRIQNDINYLASDELEGRKPGTAGAKLALNYISNVFKQNKLGTLPELKSYQQPFKVSVNVEVNTNTYFIVNNEPLKLGSDFFTSSYSANNKASGKTIYVGFGMVASELKRDDYKRKKVSKKGIVVMDIGSPDGMHPHSEYLKYHDLGERIKLAKEKGAKAVLLVNLEGQASDPSPNFKQIRDSGIPVIFVQNTALANKVKNGAEVELEVVQKETTIEAYNVIGYLDNTADNTVIIGAHYDHLGYGGSNSLFADNGEPEIHNGADDNASGTAGLLELVRFINKNPDKFKNHNFLFIAFSAEEEGLLGSAHFAKTTKMDLSKVSYMLNMDMIGRLEENTIAVSGVGTSPFWEKVITDACALKVKTSQSGTGPSDHTSFYNKDIPVLHFFTGTHSDYHKPSDDADKINVEGEVQVLGYILGVIEAAESTPDLTFTKTKAEESMVPRFTVTLGVMPDYIYSGEGMKIDGVTEGKPASVAGMQEGDVVTQLGDVKVVDMMSYMKALGQFKKGEKAKLTYMRENKTIETEVIF